MLNNKIVIDKPQRIEYLDSARGIASMMVVLGHFINWRLSNNFWVKVIPLTIVGGTDAVSFFFVLSGFVLSYKARVKCQNIFNKTFFSSIPRICNCRPFRFSLLP
jgi:peptidoglycan/LPS O-acetylase OafA/YrhL